MNIQVTHTTCYNQLELLDNILKFKLNSDEFISNEKILKKIGKEIDKISKQEKGYSLFSVIKGLDRKLILIVLDVKPRKHIFSWNIKEKIEKKIDVEIHQHSENNNLQEFLDTCNYYTLDDSVSACLTETLEGYGINIENGKKFQTYVDIDITNKSLKTEATKEFIPNVITVGKNLLSFIDSCKNSRITILRNFIKKFKEIDFQLCITETPILINKKFFAAIISDVQELNGKRFFKLDWSNFPSEPEEFSTGSVVFSANPTTTSNKININRKKDIYTFNSDSRGSHDYDVIKLSNLPYNFVDKGRLILCFNNDYYSYIGLISEDPKINSDYITSFENNAKEIIKTEVEKGISINDSYITDEKNKIYYSSYDKNNNSTTPSPILSKLKNLKNMFDEYKYVIKKHKCLGEDVTITDKIKYNHKQGKISYNDFSMAIDDEYIRSLLFTEFKSNVVEFYRNNISEQDILNSLIDKCFNALSARLETKQTEDINIPIELNNINLTINGKSSIRKSKATDNIISIGKMYYINDQRFNKNELLVVLREMTCYRDQEEANNFIKNIGRLGLSVYIGITTGYEVNLSKNDESINRIFKFKKLKGRSKYQLLLDNTNIPITGKKLISLLYSNFIGERPVNFKNKIPQLIFECSGSTYEYIKYKSLIDSTYEKYKNNAFEFLNKKVVELGAEFVSYNSEKSRKILDAIYITGISGKNYVIAYDSKNSFVFMDPVIETNNAEKKLYKQGKYICMIDQSNIKSNISFDTVVSKLLALKNDSSIAHTIYNLQEELE